MLYFKNPLGVIFAYETVTHKEKFGDKALIPLTPAEVALHEKVPPFSDDIEAKKERVWRDSQLTLADIELNKVQDSDPKAVGSVADWRAYRKVLRAWPEHKDFPNKEKRPVSPDA